MTTAPTATELQRTVGEWGATTFPEETPTSILAHLQEEVDELKDLNQPMDQFQEEAAAVYLILLHIAHRTGFSLHDAAVAKFNEVNDAEWEIRDRGYRKRVKAPVAPPSAGGEETA